MKAILFFGAFVFLFFSAYSQVDEVEFREFVKDYHFAKSINDEMVLDEVEGTPYLTESYQNSKIYFQSIEKTLVSELRYNAYSGEFEFLQKLKSA